MILGIGTDIVAIDRIEEAISRYGDRFVHRILTETEYIIYQQSPSPAAYLAKRFAAKEAVAKAFGTGIGKISWQDLETTHTPAGAPQIICHRNARDLLAQMGGERIHISLSDESDKAVAFAVISATA